ncbi:MerR family transcriptional regulator [Actinomadura verrucosospora]|uniref:MerR family transcriptional regulator n=1 Tax=Actinomadura verrucosospora TaxID=46165 RepID=A0A7D3ZP89_ACTVE|nr:MerR family transcriptional regulator [Actinomadura verrucosospora]QKG23963.1 MerR family transcriptional regulator [Actinomadura verrucosospora]
MSAHVIGLVRDTGPVTHAGEDGLTVGRAAALVGVSVKTLHHWDAVGLVRPGGHTAAGYRVYAADDIARIHRVLVYRELGFPLAEIARILDDPSADARDHLRRQRAELERRAGRLREMARAVDRMLDALDSGLRLTPEEQVEIFGADWRPEWVEDARDRWGGSAQWTQYAERAAGMTAQDWKDVAARTEAFNADLAAARRAGAVPGSAEANALAERHRALMATYFDCTHAMHACLGRMFADDPGFAGYYDAVEPGLALWFRDTIFANAETHGVTPATARWE